MRRNPKDFLIFPLDFSSKEEAIKYVKLLSDYVNFFKIGLELFIAYGPEIVKIVKEISKKKIFLDLKIYDIPQTTKKAIDKVKSLGVDLLSLHFNPNLSLKEIRRKNLKIVAVTVLTSVKKEDLEFKDDLENLVLQRAILSKNMGFDGVVCSGKEVKKIKEVCGEDFLTIVPGIRPTWFKSKDDQKRVVTPYQAIINKADYIVVGRPIYKSEDPIKAVEAVLSEVEEAILSSGS